MEKIIQDIIKRLEALENMQTQEHTPMAKQSRKSKETILTTLNKQSRDYKRNRLINLLKK